MPWVRQGIKLVGIFRPLCAVIYYPSHVLRPIFPLSCLAVLACVVTQTHLNFHARMTKITFLRPFLYASLRDNSAPAYVPYFSGYYAHPRITRTNLKRPFFLVSVNNYLYSAH